MGNIEKKSGRLSERFDNGKETFLTEAILREVKRPVAELMAPAVVEFCEKAEGVTRQENLSIFIETLFRKQAKHHWGPYHVSVMHSLKKAAYSKGYIVDDKWINRELTRWEGPKNFKDIFVFNNDELTVIYPYEQEKISEQEISPWIEALFGAYAVLQKKIGVSERQTALFLDSENFPLSDSGNKHAGYTFIGDVRIDSSQEIGEQIITALHELSHGLLDRAILNKTKEISRKEITHRSFNFFYEFLEEGYLDAQVYSLFGVSPHLIFFRELLGRSRERTGGNFFQEDFENILAKTTDEIAATMSWSMMVSFFHFISQKSGKEDFNCFLDIIFSGLEVKAAIEKITSLVWDDIAPLWANDIVEEIKKLSNK